MAADEKFSLQSLHPKAGFVSLALLGLNILLLVYSHLGISADILSNLSPTEYYDLLGLNAKEPTLNRPLTGYCPAPAGSGAGCSPADLQHMFDSGNSSYLESIYDPCGAACGIQMLMGWLQAHEVFGFCILTYFCGRSDLLQCLRGLELLVGLC